MCVCLRAHVYVYVHVRVYVCMCIDFELLSWQMMLIVGAWFIKCFRGLWFFKHIFKVYIWCVYLCMLRDVHAAVLVAVWVNHGWSLGHWAWQQVPFPAGPSPWPWCGWFFIEDGTCNNLQFCFFFNGSQKSSYLIVIWHSKCFKNRFEEKEITAAVTKHFGYNQDSVLILTCVASI